MAPRCYYLSRRHKINSSLFNIATCFISVLSLAVSALTYRNSTYKPDLRIDGNVTEEIVTKADKQNKVHMVEVIMSNKGKAPAKNVRLTLWPIRSKNPKAFLGPEKAYTSSLTSNKYIITLPVIGAGNEQYILVPDKIGEIDKSDEIRNTYYMNVDCDEGVDKSNILLATGPRIKYTCIECHAYKGYPKSI